MNIILPQCDIETTICQVKQLMEQKKNLSIKSWWYSLSLDMEDKQLRYVKVKIHTKYSILELDY